ncbi:hypothetical protein JJJ17_02050 [Paracoccus caeni]|uniref:Sulfotransferase domain-containing protein n=1 Tax=Paracoccus caeni TaxID=657651 RepID=A0A934SFZ7_9RHOB|nr:hypothetical protein [Paracoccus caeni]MBK4214702.1 hypothetical protein [Paracoccus caeni]
METFVHIGCHKTGTTYLQNLLAANLSLLSREGVGYLPLSELRGDIIPKAISCEHPLGYIKSRISTSGHDNLRSILLSDENIIGTCSEFVSTGVAYPNAEHKLKRIFRDSDKVVFFMCIRRPSDFIVSAWAEAIRFRSYVGLDNFTNLVKNRGFSWFSVVRRIKDIIGENKLFVWTYENNEFGVDYLIEKLTKARLLRSDLVAPNEVAGRSSMSQEGYDLLYLMDKLLGRDVVIKYSKAVARSATTGPSMKKNLLLPANVSSKWDDEYLVDLDKIREIPGVSIVHSI